MCVCIIAVHLLETTTNMTTTNMTTNNIKSHRKCCTWIASQSSGHVTITYCE